MTFTVQPAQLESAQSAMDDYFEELYKQGPGGMRSQCYTVQSDDTRFVHIKSFRRESIANQHFRSPEFRNYIQQLAVACTEKPAFSRLMQQQTFESIY
jgi:quinol monooxygenase YgiN